VRLGSAGGLCCLLASACSESVATITPQAPRADLFYKRTLDTAPGEPISLAVLPDASVLYASRRGQLWWRSPGGDKLEAAHFEVYTHDEEGLQGLALDPDFEHTHWVYLYYSPRLNTVPDDPATPGSDEGLAPEQGQAEDWAPFQGVLRLSRFRFDAPSLDLGSEQVLLEVPVDRGLCCHLGGQIDFDGAGNLYLSTGDDTNPFQSQGYAPLDERPGHHPGFDAQRSAANTNDLRGKLLRIHVEPDGSYTIPEGNLFAPGTAGTRPEIYVMGLRNPFRFSVDRAQEQIYLADYSPDARTPDPLRGPIGTGKWMVVRHAGNYGWPYCATPSDPYVAYDFATGQSGSAFDCAHPVNGSSHNTGLVELPPVQAPDVTYSFGSTPRWPELGAGGVGPMAGPAYVYVEGRSSLEWPAEYAGAPLFYDWTRDLVSAFRLSAAGTLESMQRVNTTFTVDNPIDMEFGPDGALYVLEYGDGYNSANPDAQLSRIEYVGAQNSSASQ
jgi:cytochrome c